MFGSVWNSMRINGSHENSGGSQDRIDSHMVFPIEDILQKKNTPYCLMLFRGDKRSG